MGTIIALLPDARYVVRRKGVEDHHLTLGFFGDLDLDSPQVAALRWATEKVAAHLTTFNNKTAMVSGRAVFDISQEGHGHDYAFVDLVDSWFVYSARATLDEMTSGIGVSIDRSHGFTPHMTVGYTSDPYERIQFGEIESFKVGFHSIALWSGAQRWEYDL